MSLHARKGLAKITALPHCSNMAGGGGFTGQSKKSGHVRSRYGKHKECVTCQMGLGAGIPGGGSQVWHFPGSFNLPLGEKTPSSARTARLVKGNCIWGVPCFN